MIQTKFLCVLLAALPFASAGVFAQPAQRIITLSPHAAELIFAIGAGDRLVGVISHSDYPEAAADIEVIGGHTSINIERILALEPDLVISWPGGNRAADLHQLSDLGLKMIQSSPSADFHQLAETLHQLGAATGQQAQSSRIAADYLEALDKLEQRYADASPVAVFYQLWNAPLMTVGQDKWIQAQIEFCGGENLFADSPMPYPKVNMEQVILRSPQVIIYPESQSGVINQWQSWEDVPAVKTNQLHGINADLNHIYSPRLIQGLTQLCEAIDSAREITRIHAEQ